MICFLKRYENDIRLEENQKRVQTANPSICSVREYSNCQKTPEATVTVNSYSAHRIVNLQYPFVEPDTVHHYESRDYSYYSSAQVVYKRWERLRPTQGRTRVFRTFRTIELTLLFNCKLSSRFGYSCV